MSMRYRVGDARWFVEWCDKLAFYEDSTDIDHDACTMKTRAFKTKKEAEEFAKRIWHESKQEEKFGVVSYWPSEFVPYDEDDAARYPHVGFWEDTGDAEHYEGEMP